MRALRAAAAAAAAAAVAPSNGSAANAGVANVGVATVGAANVGAATVGAANVGAATVGGAAVATVVATVGGALAAGAAYRLLTAPGRDRRRWERTNHAGEPVTLLEGPAYAVGATLAAGSPAAVVATGAAAVLGALDDLAGDARSKGLAGHIGALRRGEVTTGAVKVVGLATSGLVAAALVDRGGSSGLGAQPGTGAGSGARLVDTFAGGAVVAGAANLANLLDLRPGRALKVGVATAAPLALSGVPAAGSALGAALAMLPPDLRGEAMLGDTGANALGALIGVAALQRASRAGRWTALAALVALTLASERVSFTAVIESTPVLRELDAWGRAPR